MIETNSDCLTQRLEDDAGVQLHVYSLVTLELVRSTSLEGQAGEIKCSKEVIAVVRSYHRTLLPETQFLSVLDVWSSFWLSVASISEHFQSASDPPSLAIVPSAVPYLPHNDALRQPSNAPSDVYPLPSLPRLHFPSSSLLQVQCSLARASTGSSSRRASATIRDAEQERSSLSGRRFSRWEDGGRGLESDSTNERRAEPSRSDIE